MEFLAINLDDFHKNQKGEPRTNAEIVFIESRSILEAQRWMELNHPEHPWALVCKQVFDANIVTRQVYLDN
ncbi:hypothetical protein [Hespellia stercorisuis]|uniref:Uncharacterized protein n=1 Tax=Hespellia stercorisuis DSM 15480 TaxID=1121950 RepID=A0A1M6RP45_9FIRM|nr:hypothetical protein [Hespellia stercorisuis]SHK34229.1 hypothetical protein SAMN02745243_02749 [Hespellia stercorisuis DSM 15480]